MATIIRASRSDELDARAFAGRPRSALGLRHGALEGRLAHPGATADVQPAGLLQQLTPRGRVASAAADSLPSAVLVVTMHGRRTYLAGGEEGRSAAVASRRPALVMCGLHGP
jgi:hypothetical protein